MEGVSALPDPATAGIGSLEYGGLQKQDWRGSGSNLRDPWDDLMQSAFGDSVVTRQMKALAALRAGDAQTAHEQTMPIAMDLASFVGNIKPVGGPIRAYHGSPYDFDKFSMDKIGSGEGAQAYGHGLYFAENEGVARSYRMINAPPGMGSHQARLAQTALDKFSEMPPKEARIAAIDWLQKEAPKANALPPQYYYDAINNFDALTGGRGAPGRMYEVNIHADPGRFLDWDKPISRQNAVVKPAVMDALYSKIEDTPIAADVMRNIKNGRRDYSASEVYSAMFNPWHTKGPDATDALRAAGIPGIRYFDAGSRHDGKGSRNYVVFDDALIEILRKYGIGGILAGGAAGIGSLGLSDEDGL